MGLLYQAKPKQEDTPSACPPVAERGLDHPLFFFLNSIHVTRRDNAGGERSDCNSDKGRHHCDNVSYCGRRVNIPVTHCSQADRSPIHRLKKLSKIFCAVRVQIFLISEDAQKPHFMAQPTLEDSSIYSTY